MNGVTLERYLPALAKQARVEACRLIGLGWFRPDDRDDLEQDLLLHVWRKRETVPASDGMGAAYCAATFRNKCRDLVRREYAPGSDRRKRAPLPEDVFADDPQPNLPRALISHPQYDHGIDVRRVIERLPPAKRRFAWLLADRGLVAAAEAAGISRSTASRWKLELRVLLTAQGLGRERREGGRRS